MKRKYSESITSMGRYCLATVLMLATASVSAVEITGVPGSASATTTIDGRQLPPPPDTHFGGKIERNAIDSTPY